jgi:hypothetical protein
MSGGSHDELCGEVVLYQAKDGTVSLDVRLERESLWLSQRQMAQLFDKDTDTIGLHLRNIYGEGELEESATTEESSVVQTEGDRQVRRKVRFYNLDVIISVGYRVNSKRGTQFRIWATGVLRDHILQGYSVNENRLRDLNQAVRLIADTVNRRDLTVVDADPFCASAPLRSVAGSVVVSTVRTSRGRSGTGSRALRSRPRADASATPPAPGAPPRKGRG